MESENFKLASTDDGSVVGAHMAFGENQNQVWKFEPTGADYGYYVVNTAYNCNLNYDDKGKLTCVQTPATDH